MTMAMSGFVLASKQITNVFFDDDDDTHLFVCTFC